MEIKTTKRICGAGMWVMLACLAVLLGVLFRESFRPGIAAFNNDGPLGPLSADNAKLPSLFTGYWADLNWVGKAQPNAFPNFTYAFLMFFGAVGYSKFFTPFSILFVGMSAWLFFRQMGFRPAVCVLGGLAAALNGDFFSYACWGLGGLTVSVGALFLALAALVTPTRHWWLKAAVAGAALGFSLMEGYDNGAIFSLYVAAFVMFLFWNQDGKPVLRLTRGVVATGLVALFAAYLAAQTLVSLVGTQLKGVAGMDQDARSKGENWDWATGWSFPKMETLRLIIPGLYGYRLDTGGGGNYWGAMGRDPAWEQYLDKGGVPPDPRLSLRHSGSGPYGGVLVALGAAWAVAQAFRKQKPLCRPAERRHIWFWAGLGLVALLIAYGRHAPFYRLVYLLPYFSTIRIPAKHLHVFHVALVILFGFGLELLFRQALARATEPLKSVKAPLKQWWATAPVFERRWTQAICGVFAVSALSWFIYDSSQRQLAQHLHKVGFPADGMPGLAESIAKFSAGELGLFVVFLGLSVAAVTGVLSGALSGRRAGWAAVAIGGVLVVDHVRANQPWILHYNYQEKYATNPVIDILRQKPWEGRVASLFLPLDGEAGQVQGLLQQIYQIDWTQHHFQYYNVQSLDIVQEPRPAIENLLFRSQFPPTNMASRLRLWELTNTRYHLGMAGLVDLFNTKLDPELKRFRLHTGFTFTQEKPGAPWLVQTNATGPFGLIEFTGVLPRTQLYANWLATTNDETALKTLVDPAFRPATTVIVDGELPGAAGPTNAVAGTVVFKRYAPKRIELAAEAKAPCVLLLNDKHDPNWEVRVDGQVKPLLRCNFLMRGVYLEPGTHTVEFRYAPPYGTLYISLSAILVGLGLSAVLGWTAARERTAARP